jgi:SAM-dependent methyltransferase
MNKTLEKVIICPQCGSSLNTSHRRYWNCDHCGLKVPILYRKPIFTEIPSNIEPMEKIERSPELGTPWRRSNWKFLIKTVKSLNQDALILDVGAGRGDFKAAFRGKKYLSLDIYPYPEIDLVCDLIDKVPFKQDSFDMVTLLNVCEHVYDPANLIKRIFPIIKPGGKMLITIPFLLKIHQEPVDYGRYTNIALERMGKDAGFHVEEIDCFFDYVGLIQEAISEFRFWGLNETSNVKRNMARGLLANIQFSVNYLESLVGRGDVKNLKETDSPAPIGYHVIFRKLLPGSNPP